jgi:hypothetical protein
MQSAMRVPAAGRRVGIELNIPHTHSVLLPQQVEAFSDMAATVRVFFLSARRWFGRWG